MRYTAVMTHFRAKVAARNPSFQFSLSHSESSPDFFLSIETIPVPIEKKLLDFHSVANVVRYGNYAT